MLLLSEGTGSLGMGVPPYNGMMIASLLLTLALVLTYVVHFTYSVMILALMDISLRSARASPSARLSRARWESQLDLHELVGP